jgi:hypothetical protein
VNGWSPKGNCSLAGMVDSLPPGVVVIHSGWKMSPGCGAISDGIRPLGVGVSDHTLANRLAVRSNTSWTSTGAPACR